MFDGLEFIDFKIIQQELNLIKEEKISLLAPMKNTDIGKYDEELKLINEICVEALILVANVIYKQINSSK